MNDLFDKSKHQDEFRLRILMTDGCNKNCSFCLNDFQEKPKGKPKFVPPSDAHGAIVAYCEFMRQMKMQPVVTFSGGEPGIHPRIHEIIPTAKRHGAFVKVVTNGTALYLTQLKKHVDCWHVSVTGKNEQLIEFLETNPGYNVQIQNVLVRDSKYIGRKYFPLREPWQLIKFYGSRGFPIKLWVNFFESSQDKKGTEATIEGLVNMFPDYEIKSRFTGKQENRGEACRGCTIPCVTLKALWVFADGSASTCPQGYRDRRRPMYWFRTVQRAYKAHKVEERNELLA